MAESNSDADQQARAAFLKQHAEKKEDAGKKDKEKKPKAAKATPAPEAEAKPAGKPPEGKEGKKKDGKEAKGDKTATTDAKPATDAEGKPMPKLSLPLPKGQDSKGIVIPYTDTTGKKSMVFNIGVGNRPDDERVNMRDLLIETFDENGQKEMTIAMPGSQMNMTTRIIQTEETVTIKRSDFQLTGQKMEFNTETKQGWIKGNVKMIIYDLSEETGENAPKKEGQGS